MYVEHIQLQRSFAFCRVWGSDEEHELHVHDCLEIGIVIRNELEYRFNNKTYIGHPGDVFLCRPFEPHWSFAKSEKPFECILVLFQPSVVRSMPNGHLLLKPFYTSQGVQPFIPACSNYARAIKQAAESAMKAKENGTETGVTRQYMHLMEILLQVNEYGNESLAAADWDLGGFEIVEVIGYMLENFQMPLDAGTLSRQAGMGRTMFFKEFRRLTGGTPNEFLNQLRLQHAMNLLRSTNESMLDLAFASGFQSLSTFNKNFKRFTGQSPREYRKTK